MKNTRAVSIVMPWDCSSFRASIRKAYSKGLELRAAVFLHLLKLALGQRSRIGQQPPDDRALAVIDMPGYHDIHFLLFKLLCHIDPLPGRS